MTKSLFNNSSTLLDNVVQAVDFLSQTVSLYSMIYIKNINLEYIYASTQYAKHVYDSDNDQMRNKTDLALITQAKLSTFSTANHDEDAECLKNNHAVYYLKLHIDGDEGSPLIFHKFALTDNESKQIIGLMVRVLEPPTLNIANTIIKSYNIRFSNINPQIINNSIRLTKRERQVAFLFLANFSSTDIATIISHIENRPISKDYIDKVFTRQLYKKFAVNDRKTLYDQMAKFNSLSYPPVELLQSYSIKLN